MGIVPYGSGAEVSQQPVGSGPFRFVRAEQDKEVVIERNDNYWGARAKVSRVRFMVVPDSTTRALELRKGSADVAINALAPDTVVTLQRDPSLRVLQGPGTVLAYVAFNLRDPILQDVRVRQAIAYALDRERMVDIMMDGKAALAEGFTQPGVWWYDSELKSYPHDPEKAKALLAEAGLPPGLQLHLSTQPVTLYQQISQLAQEQLKAVGLDVQIEPVSISDWYPLLIQGAINFLPIRWTQRPDPDGLFTYLFHGSSKANTSHYVNPEVDALLDKARSLQGQAERAPLYREAQRITVHDLPYIPLFFSVEYAAMRDSVRGFVWIPDEIPRFRSVWKAAR